MCELLDYQGDDCHIIYKNIRIVDGNEPEHCEKIRTHIAKLWAQFKPYADPHFIQEFRRNPDQRYWEMYLGCCLLNKGVRLIATNGIGPDFCINTGKNKIWIEAITPTAGSDDNPDRVPEMITLSEGGGAQEVPRDKIILRFRSALAEKENKFRSYMTNQIVQTGDIKIIALSSAAVRGWSKGATIPYILSAVFPVGHAYISINPKTGSVVDRGYQFQSAIAKTNGKTVETQFFTDLMHSDVSAVIYSDGDLGNPPSQLGNDLFIIHNPLATNPLPHGQLPYAREYWAEDDGEMWKIHSRRLEETT